MQQAFLIIISVLGAIYALFTKQNKTALGLLVIAISFVFVIPDLVTGIWVGVFEAIQMILFVVGILIIVFKKKSKESTENKNSSSSEKWI